MNLSRIRRVLKYEYILLLLVMALAFYMAFIPHQHYPYPVHLDEWMHLAFSNEIIEEASAVGLADPFSGGTPIANQTLEVGFHLFLAVFHQISGLPWLDIFRFFPGIVFMMTVLSVYVLAQRQGFGWEAALLTCLIPTTVGILGPGFLVPVAMGMLFIPLALFIAFNFRSWWSYVVLLIFILFLACMHSATAVGLIIILIPYILLNLRSDFRHSVGITLALAIPVLAALPWLNTLVLSAAKAMFNPEPISGIVDIPRVIPSYGYLPILLCLLGIFLLAMRRGKKNYGLVFGSLILFVLLAIFFTFHYGIGMMYYRGLMYMMLMMSIVAGAGLMAVKNLKLPEGFTARLKVPLVMRNVGYILCLILIGLTLYIAIPARQNIPYYHMIDREDYEAFIWIKENVGSGYNKAILDPWKGSAFTAISSKNVYTWIGAYPTASDMEAYDFLGGGSIDTPFLRENGISIVYTRSECNNADLTEVRKYVYLLKEAEIQQRWLGPDEIQMLSIQLSRLRSEVGQDKQAFRLSE